jgi:phosphomannomutase
MSRAAAFDLDGTLAASKQPLTSDMAALLAKLCAKMPVAIMSGDSWAHFEEKVLELLPADSKLEQLYLFPTNAGYCFTYDGAWHAKYAHDFTPEERDEILTALNTALNNVGLLHAPDKTWGDRIEDRGAQISFSPLGQDAPVDAKEEWKAQNNDMRTALWQELSKLLPNFDVKMGGITTVDIIHKGITKAYGMRQFSELTKIPIEEMLYVGDALQDGGNDEVVKETSVQTREVSGPEEATRVIEELLH